MFEIYIYPEQVINDDKYYKLLEFLLKKCDKVAFTTPNFETVFSFQDFKTAFNEYNKIKSQLNRNNQRYKEYIKNIENLLNQTDVYLVKKYLGNQYFDQMNSHEIETYIYTYNEEVFKIFKEVGGLYKWRYPNFPEDLFFFKNDKIFLKSISHESVCWIYDDDEETIDFIDELGLDYCVYEDDVEWVFGIDDLEVIREKYYSD